MDILISLVFLGVISAFVYMAFDAAHHDKS